MKRNQLGGTMMNSKSNLLKYLVAVCMLVVSLGAVSVVQAAQITDITLLDSKDGDVLRIESSGTLNYQVFDLDGPPRLILSFPEATLADGVKGLTLSGDGVTRVYPVSDKGAVRLEVSLSEVLTYNIQENKGNILVRFAGVKAQKKASAGVHAVIQDIEVRDRGSVTELILRGEHMDANHNAFMTEGNKQLILDFWGASSHLKKTIFQYSTQRINAVMVGQADDRVRLVIKLLPTLDMHQQIDASAGEMVVRLGRVTTKKKASVLEVESVDFQPDDRIAHVMIRTDGTAPVISVREKDDHVVIDVKKAKLLAGQERSQDVSAFPGPVRQIDTYQLGDQVRIVTRLREKVSVTSFQQGNVFTINFEPEDLALARMNTGERDDFAYTGQKVTFDFKDIDIRNALKLIAEMSDLNIIMSDDVTGMLTMRLVDVPWDQALELILSARGLGKQQSGNVMRIAPMEVLRSEYETRLQAQRGSQQLEPLLTEFITLSYTKVEDVKKIIEGASANATKKTGGGAGATGGGTGATGGGIETSVGILSPRGSFLIDARTNTLIIKDTEKSINAIKRLVAVVDKPIKQVLIEARIVEASDNFSRDLGVAWGGKYSGNNGNAPNNTVSVGGTRNSAGATGGNGMLVDLPATVAAGSGGAIGVALGTLSNVFNLNLELSAAEAEGEVKIVSNPRVITTNLKPATISQGFDVAFQTAGVAGAPPTVTFKKAELKLTATPQITADNHVIMQLLVTKNSPIINLIGNGTNISTKQIDTEVYMDNGETVVIGGIYSRTIDTSKQSVPGLASIPILGYLFQRNVKKDNRSELLIFVTPKILNTASESR
ncbi:MAG: pilus assembly protein PilQ [Proteobacteria bacterium]|nr:MAG: pilus assembly protein PilQ [Pseudomonadota bacterium]